MADTVGVHVSCKEVRMVQLPSRAELGKLESFNQPFCLTIYAPHIEFDPTGATNPNKIELKNMLHQAETVLLDDGVDPATVKKMLRPARELLNNHEFWPLRQESLALFLHPKFFRHYHLPDSVPYLLTVKRGFNLKPLKNAMQDNRSYLLLALSRNNVELYEGDRFGLKKLRLKHFPSNLEEALHIDEYPKVAETHAIAPAGGKGSEAFHGQYNVNQTNKEMLLLFFQMIDRSLHKLLRQKDEPLILAGVGYLLPIYRQANSSPHLVSEGLTVNVEHESPDALRKRAWSLLKREEMT